jgi:ubiquinone/menaquinone biosynthesis C-methylase UbiE
VSVFDSGYAKQYDRLYSAKDYRAECDLIEAAISRYGAARPESVLDIGCGTGKHSCELATRGYAVTGIDLSESMLRHARERSATLTTGKPPTWICGDARTFDAGGKFDVAIMMFAVIGYLTRNEDVLACLRNIRRHLEPKALFACDFWYGPSVLSDRPTDRVRVLPTENGEVIRATSTTIDVVAHTAEVTFRLWAMENRQVVSETRESHSLRFFFPQEFALMLSQSGFEMLGISAFPTLDAPLDDTTWNAFVIARAV